MFRNYLNIALKVLARRKFLTFVNLFGILVTLTVLIIGSAVVETMLFPRGAQHQAAHTLTIDTVCFVGGGGASTWNDGVGHQFYTRYVVPLQTPDDRSFFSRNATAVSYQTGSKVESQMRRTDASYWRILDFTFLDGRPISQDDVAQGRMVAVINRATRDRLFSNSGAIGQSITANGQTFRVIGVVENESQLAKRAYADIWVPLTTAPSQGYLDEWIAGYNVLLWVDDPARRGAMQAEFRAALDNFEYTPAPEDFDEAYAIAESSMDDLSNDMMGEYCTSDSAVAGMSGLVALMVLGFMLLPAVNMINLNVSRILERAPEIGLRKAVGATRRDLIGQFIVENLVLTLLGGLLAFAVTPFLLSLFNGSLVRYGELALNFRVFAVGLVLVVVFGVLSGAYPAWKMARLAPAQALRGGSTHV